MKTTLLETILYKALKEFKSIDHRLIMCDKEDCIICEETNKILKTVDEAIRSYEDKNNATG